MSWRRSTDCWRPPPAAAIGSAPPVPRDTGRKSWRTLDLEVRPRLFSNIGQFHSATSAKSAKSAPSAQDAAFRPERLRPKPSMLFQRNDRGFRGSARINTSATEHAQHPDEKCQSVPIQESLIELVVTQRTWMDQFTPLVATI